ncbi:hypothetical protein IRZ59_16060 [Pseudomonas guariconensis]|uniref:hypothetical protein n=1 Tax=Pseudomonas guariconensis TaxID=1288410 RepID=UPI0018AA08DE|nr:hypothetical protein [Pseudomonas guariconensis]MBF8731952.1 hypothetical protein [Pseudomonas guariconensis]
MAAEAVSAVMSNPMYAEITFYLSIAAATVGAGTFIVGYSQMRIASAKIKLDLYNKRFAVYAAALEYYQCVWDKREGTKEKAAEFIKGYRESQFLFATSDGIYETLGRIMQNANVVVSSDEIKKQQGEGKPSKGSLAESLHRRAEEARLDLGKDLLLLETQMNDYIDFKVIEGWHFWWRLRWLKKLWRWMRKGNPAKKMSGK